MRSRGRSSRRCVLNEKLRQDVKAELQGHPEARLTQLLAALGVAISTWYRRRVPAERRKVSGPAPKPISPELVEAVLQMARTNPWYGYQRIAVMCRRAGHRVRNRHAYRIMKEHGLLHVRRPRAPELYQAAKLYELLPSGPNELWQMDVTYVHIPGHGWWYAITVIDYYSRYLLAMRLTWSYCASEATRALDEARAEAERLCGPLTRRPFLVTDNGSSFVAKRFLRHVKDLYGHVRIRYRTPTQLGLLERFHRSLKEEEIYWRLYESPDHARACLAEFRTRYNTVRPHWALVPAAGGDPLVPFEVYVEGRAVQIPKWQGWARGAKARLAELLAADGEVRKHAS